MAAHAVAFRCVALAMVALAGTAAAASPDIVPAAPGAAAATAPGAVGANAAAAIRQHVVDSLLCRNEKGNGESLQAMHDLLDQKAVLQANGMHIETHGEEMDERITIRFDAPLQVAGASTTRVTMAFDTPYAGFAALTWGEFTGDPKTAIGELQLKAAAKGDRGAIAPWYRNAANIGAICPAQIGLKQLAPNRFALGCGWCNG